MSTGCAPPAPLAARNFQRNQKFYIPPFFKQMAVSFLFLENVAH
jgi:hypothetical protein